MSVLRATVGPALGLTHAGPGRVVARVGDGVTSVPLGAPGPALGGTVRAVRTFLVSGVPGAGKTTLVSPAVSAPAGLSRPRRGTPLRCGPGRARRQARPGTPRS